MTFGFYQRQKGFTLIEVLLSLGLFALIAVGIIEGAQANTRANAIIDQKVVAETLATGYIEAIKQSPFTDNYSSATANISIPLQYSVTVLTYGTDNYTDWVGPPSSNQTLQKIVVSVSQGGKQITTICTYRAKR